MEYKSEREANDSHSKVTSTLHVTPLTSDNVSKLTSSDVKGGYGGKGPEGPAPPIAAQRNSFLD